MLALLAVALPAAAQNQPHMTRLRNRLAVITKEVHSSNVVAITVFVRGGAAADPAGLPGLANFTQRMLLRGTTRRTAEQIREPVEAFGGTLTGRTDQDYSQLLLLSSAHTLETGLELLADVVRNPRFDPDEIEKERKEALDALARADNDPNWLLQQSVAQALYASGPYARPVAGTPEAVRRITRQDLVRFHQRHYVPENLIVVVVGNIDRAAAEEKVERYFGDMPASGQPPAPPPSATVRPPGEFASKVIIKERDLSRSPDPGEQALAHLLAAFPVGPVTRQEYPALLVLNAILGGGMSSRLVREVRERRSLAYTVGTYYADYLAGGYLGAFLKTWPEREPPDNPYQREMVLNKAKDALIEQFDWVRDHPVPDAELERARRYAIGTFLYSHQRTLSQAHWLGWFELAGLGYRFDDELPDAIARVTKEDVQQVARKYLTHYALALVVPQPQQRLEGSPEAGE